MGLLKRDETMRKGFLVILFVVSIFISAAAASDAETGKKVSDEELAKKLQNPVAYLISAPFQNNFQSGLGPKHEGFQYMLRFQPVIPINMNPNWNVILRPILPLINQTHAIGRTHQTGLGDLQQEVFFSPTKPGPAGLIWGAGPIGLFPTAANEFLGNGKWGLGPTGVVLKQVGGFTGGILGYQLWSFAGDNARQDVCWTYLQPFASYTLKSAFTVFGQSETTYDWEAKEWEFPIITGVSQVFSMGKQKMSIALGGIYYPVTPSGEPKWGIRLTWTLLFPE